MPVCSASLASRISVWTIARCGQLFAEDCAHCSTSCTSSRARCGAGTRLRRSSSAATVPKVLARVLDVLLETLCQGIEDSSGAVMRSGSLLICPSVFRLTHGQAAAYRVSAEGIELAQLFTMPIIISSRCRGRERRRRSRQRPKAE
jgi:hypothetical protein